jgi:hypothetical protein
MELEGYKTAWRNRSVESHPLSSPSMISRSRRFLRTTAIHDLQRSEELTRLIFSLLFALVAIGGSLMVMPSVPGRIAAWLLALALVVDGATGLALLAKRFGEPATTSMLDYIKREHRLAENRLRFERYTQVLIYVLAAGALLLAVFGPNMATPRENAFDLLGRSAVVTAFLAVVWRRAKSRSRDVCRELERYLNELDK